MGESSSRAGEMIVAFKILAAKSEEKRQLGRQA
jgi:hypothetical protein